MSVRRLPDPAPTPLQVQLAALYDLLADTRERLDDLAYTVFVEIACDRIGLEAGRLLLGELTRADKGLAA